jgi:hypothetical protein
MPEPYVNEGIDRIHKKDVEIRAVQEAARKYAQEEKDKEEIRWFEKHYKHNARLMFTIAKKLIRFGVKEIGFHTMFCDRMNDIRQYLVMTQLDPNETMQNVAKGKSFRSKVAKNYLELVQMFLSEEEFKMYGYSYHWFSHLNFDEGDWREKWIEWNKWLDAGNYEVKE